MNKKICLFDGSNTDNWQTLDGKPAGWPINENYMTVGRGNIITRETYADAYFHVEFLCPDVLGDTGNSGVYLQGAYEIQILNSYGTAPSMSSCGAVYGIHAPLVNASLPPGEWQTYDMFFRAPRICGEGDVTEKARLTLLHNGIVIHNNVILEHTTPSGMTDEIKTEGPLFLQQYSVNDKVQFRNIWVIKL